MLRRAEEVRLDGFCVAGTRLFEDDRLIMEFPAPVTGVARLGSTLFIILHPHTSSSDPDFATTNLWAVSTRGELLWKVPKDPKQVDPFWLVFIYDDDGPKVRAHFEDRGVAVFDPQTGQRLTIPYKQPEEIHRTLITKTTAAQDLLRHASP